MRLYFTILAIAAASSFLFGVLSLTWYFGFKLITGRFPGRFTGEHGWSICDNCGTAFTDGPFCPECGRN